MYFAGLRGVGMSVKFQVVFYSMYGPYGATTLAVIDGSRQPSQNELAIPRSQGRHVVQIMKALVAGHKPIR
jgi:hypothetical protein